MKIKHLLEARRESHINDSREAGHSAAIAYIKKLIKQVPIDQIGVQLGTIEKVGINPQSKYETPIAVCAYPADYYWNMKADNLDLPFQDTAPYIHIFEMSEPAFEIDMVDHAEYDELLRKLWANSNAIASVIKLSEAEFTEILSEIIANAPREARVNSYGGYFWYIVYALAQRRTGRTNSGTHKSAVGWNKILRILGIKSIVDNGAGILHPNEPTQLQVYDSTSITLRKTIKNTPDVGSSMIASFLSNFEPTTHYIADAGLYMVYEATDDEKKSTEAIKLARSMAAAAVANPAIIGGVADRIIQWIDKTANNSKFTALTVRGKIIRMWDFYRRNIEALGKILNKGKMAQEYADDSSVYYDFLHIYQGTIDNLHELLDVLERVNAANDPQLTSIYRNASEIYNKLRTQMPKLATHE